MNEDDDLSTVILVEKNEKITDMSKMFYECTLLIVIDLSLLNIQNVTEM